MASKHFLVQYLLHYGNKEMLNLSLPPVRLHRVWQVPLRGLAAPHRGEPLGPGGVQGGARHAQLQGGGPAGPRRGVVQGRRACGDGPRRPTLAPHAAAQRGAVLPAHRARPPQQARRGRVHVRGAQLPGRGRQPQRLAGGRR